MTLELIHNSEIELEEKRIYWSFSARKQCTSSIGIFCFGVLLCLLSYVNETETSKIDDILFSIGVAAIFMALFFFYALAKSKSRYMDNLMNYNKSQEGKKISFEFSEKALIYTSEEVKTSIAWSRFDKQLLEHKNILMLKLKYSEQSHYLFNKKEVGEDKYNEIKEFLITKLTK